MIRIKKKLIAIYQEVNGIPLVINCMFKKIFYPKDTIILKGFFIFKNWRLANFNWGDDINYYFLKEVTGCKIVLLPDTKLAEKISYRNFLCIGSTIMLFDMKNTIVWGSGLLNNEMGFKIKSPPKQILAVRGPLTRQWLLDQGIECPEVYGDPALLLPKFYLPKCKVNYRMGVIPHYIDVSNPIVEKIVKCENVKFIRINGYNDWHEFINNINECDFVISSSLHGLIVSEAYKVPALWVKFSGTTYADGWNFKFHDFYESIQKYSAQPLYVNNDTTMEELCFAAERWVEGEINTEKLLEVCPFKNFEILK